MKKWFKRIFYFLLIAFVVIQFFRIDKSIPEYEKSGDFIATLHPDKNVSNILMNACYDCHSYESKYPWYSEIAPISWWVGSHIEEGREHLNFSVWSSYSAADQNEMLDESIEEIKENKMPDPNYVRMHSNANLSAADRQVLIDFFQISMSGVVSEGGGEEDHDEHDDE